MARSSSQKFISRVRAPRVCITYEVETFGASKEFQLPFVIGVLADLVGKPSTPQPGLESRRMTPIDVDNFDARMQELKPRAAFSTADTLRGEGEMLVDLTFERMDDFMPASIARKIPDLDKLLQARTQLVNLAAYMDGKTGAESLVSSLLSDTHLQGEGISATHLQGEGTRTQQPAPEACALSSQPPADLSSLLQKQFKPKTDLALAQVRTALQTLLAQARSVDISAGQEPAAIIAAIVAGIDRRLTRQINLILHHPDFQQLESAWRGLLYLVTTVESNETLKIRFMSLSKVELGKVIARYRGPAWDQSPLFKKIYEEEYGQLGGEPYGCLIGDYEFSQSPPDIEILTGMAEIAAAAHAPFLAGASPALMQIRRWQDISMPRDISSLFSAPEYARWRLLRESEDSRYLTLTLPRFLARVPYGEKTDPVEDFAFEEEASGTDPSGFVWLNSAYALGANIARAFTLYGWMARIRGTESGGVVEYLPTQQFPAEDGSIGASPTEISISDRWEAELTRSGLTPLLYSKTTGSAVFFGAQSMHRAPEYDDPDVTAAAALAARLPYLLACCRFVHYIKSMARARVGAFMEREAMERWLNDWIAAYVDPDPTTSSAENKARRPLADAQIVLEPIEGNMANYRGKIYLRPSYQLEGLPISLRFVTKLPS
jgi:type VI secretion system protein ImpC